ncbi:hypothetical protein DM02DRAFT_196312 [Periconia macrospinosa]|uniref:PSP1 C-terminal domain-containing protein n=1 Tax=Periconia macrospinosa TaxID=97972 RepID=A0A2V1D874_9PLEO|nr:hypothetical protein DM02DRAFT_196312 [Periconia macrospinosa]
MSTSTFKGGLAVGGSAFDKSKLQMRRPTPDSDVLASSDEDRDHVPPARSVNPAYPVGRRPSSGWLQDIQPNRKYSLPSVSFAGSQPTTPSLELPQQTRPTTSSFPWNTSSFTSSSASTRLKEVLPSPTSAYAAGERPLPSPTTTPEVEETIGFLLNQTNSVRKAVRSQSYSVGQSETDASPAQTSNRLRSSLRHRPSKPSLLGESAAGLGQLREDDIYEMESNTTDSDQGVRLPMNYWEREQRDLKHQALLKQAAEQSARRNRATSSGSPVAQHPRRTPQSARNVPQSDYAIDEHDDNDRFSEAAKSSLTRRFSEHVGSIGRDIGPDPVGASATQDWGNVPTFAPDALGRRHSFAHYTSHTSTFQLPTLDNTQEEDEEEELSPLQTSESPGPPENFDHNAYFSGYGPASRALNASSISAAHPDPILSNVPSATPNPYTVPSGLGRPGRRIYVVAFKCSRADIFYTYDNTGLEIRRGDLVVCEGDRGVDLGQVTHADVSLEDAKKHKAQALEEHFRWLVMFSQYSVAGTGNSNPMLGSLARANGVPNNAHRAQLTGMGAQQDPDAKPKMIKRLAQQHEIYGLRDKEGQEAKAKRLAVTKTADHGFPMEILDAEFQADNHKITFFYYAEHYVNFNPLVADLFKHYKIRIWMSAVNPASVVNPAGLMQVPPPSAIGPGAILHSNNSNASLSVGPGFGNPSYRSNEQRRGRGQNIQQGNVDESFFPFANQVPLISSQQAYQMPQWGHAQAMGPDMYGRFGGSPMNYGAWYPPTTFSASPAFNNASSNASYRGGYPASTSAPTTFPGVGPNLGGLYGQYLTSQYNAYGAGNAGHGNSQGNARHHSGQGTPAGHSATPGSSSTATPAASSALNGDMAAALADMTLNK